MFSLFIKDPPSNPRLPYPSLCPLFSLRASSPIWASQASLARTHERGASRLGRSLARFRETRFTRPNRRARSQAIRYSVNVRNFKVRNIHVSFNSLMQQLASRTLQIDLNSGFCNHFFSYSLPIAKHNTTMIKIRVNDLKNPALCALLMTGHQKLLNLLHVLKLQLKTESRLCYLRKLETIKSKIHVFREFKTIPKSTTRENWSARKLKIAKFSTMPRYKTK